MCGVVEAAAYIPKLKQVFDGLPIRDHGLHASEGRMTLPLRDESSAGLLEIQTHFFEFLPVAEAESASPNVLEAHELQEGTEYFILLTTSSGLYRYNIRDVVRCTGFYGTTPLLEFRHKGAHISSITGEKLAESQVVEAVNTAVQGTSLQLNLFTLTPHWGEPPGYSLFLWCDNPAEQCGERDLQRFAADVDEQLTRVNEEYRDKRQSGRLASVRAGTSAGALAFIYDGTTVLQRWQPGAIQASMPAARSGVSRTVVGKGVRQVVREGGSLEH